MAPMTSTEHAPMTGSIARVRSDETARAIGGRGLRTEIRPLGSDRGVEREWLALCAEADRPTWWQRPETVQAWHEILNRERSTELALVRDEERRLRGLLPFFAARVWRGPACAPRYDYAPWDRSFIRKTGIRPLPVRQITTAASTPGTLLWVGPLCRPVDLESVYYEMLRALVARRGWDVIVMPAFEGKQVASWRTACRSQNIECHTQDLGRKVLTINELRPFDQIVAAGPKKFRQNVRRARASAKSVGLTFSIAEGVEACRPLLPTVANIAGSSWKSIGRSDQDMILPYGGQQQAFVERLFSTAQPGMTPAIALAHVGGVPICAYVALVQQESLTTLLTFWNGEHPDMSPGLLLLGHLLDWGGDKGLRYIDFNSTHPWIRYLADASRIQYNVVIFAPTLRGRALARLATATGRLS